MTSSRIRLLFLLVWAITFPDLLRAQDAERNAFFEKHVRPVLAQRCFSCHSEKAGKRKGGLVLDGRQGLLAGGDSGPSVVPGKPDMSLLIQAIRYGDPARRMPPSGPLPEREVADLVEWVRQGAHFPTAPTAKSDIFAEARTHWAFRPFGPAVLPPVRASSWPKKTIDVWILAELEKRELTPAVEASRRELLRRIHFDLVGLPPTPEEVEAFERDPSPDAYAHAVERLLALPQHGERWARHWLDLVRYCDKRESWANSNGQPYLYRDWVVRALNEDMPYDRFVRLQLAADHLPDARLDDVAALGFLGLSPSYWKELKLDRDVIRGVVAEEWEERIGTLGGTFLGLTVACARCHDHKHDPITSADYYALAGVLASTRETSRSLLPPVVAQRLMPVRGEVARIEAQIKESAAQKNPAAVERRAALESDLRWLKARYPDLDRPQAVAVEDARLLVLADGPYRTKLVYEAGKVQDVALQMRGNPSQEGPIVPRRFLSAFSKGEPFTHGSGRRDLADAIFRDSGALAARVLVNRVWRHHFGRGLVETPSDFGLMGDRPSHPELLDDLARRFVAKGWSLKWLHREIVLSATYRQSSRGDERAVRVDPDNRLFARMNRRRLEAEIWRDAMLAVSGNLDPAVGGPPADLGDAGNRRRTFYALVTRREPHDFLRLHDVPDATTHSANRVPTTTPIQQLFALNGPLMMQQADRFAQRLRAERSEASGRIERAFRLAYGRSPTSSQVAATLAFVDAAGGREDPAAWRQFAQVILASNEFQFVD